MARLFVGVFIPDSVKGPITDFQNSLDKMPMDSKNVESRKLHLTLTFLGDVRHDDLGEIKLGLRVVAEKYKRFSSKISGGMVIPNKDYVRVIALGVESNNNVLENLRKDIVKIVGGDSYPVHLTICRVRKISDKKLVSDFVGGIEIGKFFEVSSFSLVKSTLGGAGPRYDVVEEFQLK